MLYIGVVLILDAQQGVFYESPIVERICHYRHQRKLGIHVASTSTKEH
jgi:hypothetical protein